MCWQLYERRPHSSTDPQRVSSVAAPPGTVRPVYLTSPDAAMELLLCVPPFHALPRDVGPYTINVLKGCPIRETNIDNAPLYYVDCAGFMSCTTFADVECLWSLYTGPVYVYENEYTAGRGREVDLAALMSRDDPFGQRRAQREVRTDRAIRQLFIDDVNHLPVARRLYGGRYDIRLYAPTLRACFRAKRVTELIQQSRTK